MSLTRSVCAFSGSSTLTLPLNAMPAVPCRCPTTARIPSRSASLYRRHTSEPAFARQASLPRQARPAAEEELLYSASNLRHHADATESYDAHHGFRRPDDARDALCYGEHVIDILSSLMRTLIPRRRKTWIPKYCRKRSRIKHGFRKLYRAVTRSQGTPYAHVLPYCIVEMCLAYRLSLGTVTIAPQLQQPHHHRVDRTTW
jgi:hypothetical protein